jgi:hypothetical protein
LRAPVEIVKSAPGPNKVEFNVFISYRRSDGSKLAKWLRKRLQSYRPSREVSVCLPDDVRVRLNRGLSVFLDTSNARTTADFWSSQIVPCLERSQYLLVVSTPEIFRRRQDDIPDWVDREINTFSTFDEGVARIIVALGPKASVDRLPGLLNELSPRWGWADLRSWRPFYRLWRHAAKIDEALIDILATIANIPTTLIPVLREEERRSRNALRRRVILISATVLVTLSASAWFGYQEWLSSEANAIWGRLQFFSSNLTPIDLITLQKLAEEPEVVKRTFIAKANENSTNSNKVLRHPAALLRGVGLQPTSEEIESLLAPILPLITPETHPVEFDYVLQAIRALSSEFTAAQADAVLSRLLSVVKTSKLQWNDTSLLPVVAATAVKLSPDQISATVAQAVESLERAGPDPHVVRSLTLFIVAMPKAAIQRHLEAVQNVVVRQFEAARSSQDAMRLAQALAVLPKELNSEQQIKIVQLLLGQRQGSGFDVDAEAFAVKALSTKLRAAAAEAVYQPTIESLRRTGDRHRFWPAAETLTAISGELELPQISLAYSEVLAKIGGADDPGALMVLGETLKALAHHMKEGASASAALNASIDALAEATHLNRFKAIAQGIGGLPATPTDEQAKSMISLLIANAKRVSRGDELVAADRAAATILGALNDQQLRLTSTETMKEFRAAYDGFAGWLYAGIIAIAVQRQAVEEIPELLSFTLDRLHNRSQDIYAIRAPARVIRSLGPSLAEAQVRDVRARLTEIFPVVDNPIELEALAAVSCSLPTRSLPQEVAPAFEAILRAVRANKDVNRPPNSAGALDAIACELNDGQRTTAFAAASDRLAVAGDQDDAKTWSETAEALLRSMSDAAYVGGVLNLLKYPSTAGEATRSILSKLGQRFPDAHLASSGLADTARWAERHFPALDINEPPRRPALSADQVPQRSVIGRVPEG